jgi:hypothetical protein
MPPRYDLRVRSLSVGHLMSGSAGPEEPSVMRATLRTKPNKPMVPTAPTSPVTNPSRPMRRHIGQSLDSQGATT